MKKSYLHVFSVLTTALVMLAGCRSEIQLDKIDPTIEAQMKLALPVGSFSAKVSDFLKTNDSAEFYIDTVGGKNVVTWHRSFEYEKKITDFDFSGKIGGKSYYVDIYKQLANVWVNPGGGLAPQKLIQNDSINLPAGYTYTGRMDISISLILKDLNKPGIKQRLDSAQMDSARFSIELSKQDFEDLDWAWIDSIKLDWGTNITHIPSQVITVYEKGGQGSGSPAQKKVLSLKNFTLDMVKDHDKAAGSDNVVDSVRLIATVVYTIPGDTHKRITQNSGLNCDFEVEHLDPKAFWGWFIDKPAYYEEALDIKYDPFTFLNGATLPLANPRIDATLQTAVAGNIDFMIDYIYTLDSASGKHPATWNGAENKTYHFTQKDGCIDPKTSALTDLTNLQFYVDGSPENGNIDELIKEMPRKLAYRVGVTFDSASTPQIRVAADAMLKATATAKVPIEFHKGLKIDYTDTIKGIKLEQASIDSLLKEVNWVDSLKTTNVNVFLNIENSIPFEIEATFYCLDADNNPIMDPNDPSKLWRIFDPETLTLAGATYEPGTHNIIPARSVSNCPMTKEKLDLFPKIKSIVYYGRLNDDALQSPDMLGAQITGDNKLKVRLGLTADIDAYINLANVNVKDAKL